MRNLIAEGLIADGEVDDRSITEVAPEDLKGFDQCHFFAGIGGWSYAARLAGWADSRPMWTGSPPCQPFSVAGKRQGAGDQRHLWPVWFDLVRECRPSVIFGEQVSAAIRYGWLDQLQEDLEASDYSFGSVIVPASGVGAPHKRDRLWFVAHSISQGSQGWLSGRQDQGREVEHRYPRCGGAANSMADTDSSNRRPIEESGQSEGNSRREPDGNSSIPDTGSGSGNLADTESQRESSDESGQDCGDREFLVRARPWGNGLDDGENDRLLNRADGFDTLAHGNDPRQRSDNGSVQQDQRNNAWRSCETVQCKDGKVRVIPTEPEIFPLANGIPNRVGILRGAGNAIVPQVAAEIISCFTGADYGNH